MVPNLSFEYCEYCPCCIMYLEFILSCLFEHSNLMNLVFVSPLFLVATQVKPLKELTFNSQNITATMTSRQFQVMLDVLTNLLFARLPK